MKIANPSFLDFYHKNVLFLKMRFVYEELNGIVLNLHIFW